MLLRAGTTHARTRFSLSHQNIENEHEQAPVIHDDKNMLHKRPGNSFGTNRGTHWTVAGSVTVIILGGYFIYSSRGSNPTWRYSRG
jgi:hypothetical protein